MGDMKRKWHNLPLRTFFMLTVLIDFSIVVLLSGLIIWGCAAFRHYLLPDPDSVYLSIFKNYEDGSSSSESYLLKLDDVPVRLPQLIINDNSGTRPPDYSATYSIEKIQPGYAGLTPKRKLAYTACGITMVAAPAVLSLVGIILCSFYFYRRKLKLPLQLLSDATVQIAARNLDFRPEYHCEDEMGRLCRSFIQMQDALYANNKEMWAMLEERKNLQASVAHDLRNPIAIIQGYGEHLENKTRKGELSSEDALRIARNIGSAAKRMENYARSLHTLNQLEDITAQKSELTARRLSADLTADFSLITRQNNRILHVSDNTLQDCLPIKVDSALVYRVLENIMGNALRFSRREVFLDFVLKSHFLSITVRDDGAGFPKSMLEKCQKAGLGLGFGLSFGSAPPSGQDDHMGIGIPVSRILCQKHGGTLKISNSPQGGGSVEASFDVS